MKRLSMATDIPDLSDMSIAVGASSGVGLYISGREVDTGREMLGRFAFNAWEGSCSEILVRSVKGIHVYVNDLSCGHRDRSYSPSNRDWCAANQCASGRFLWEPKTTAWVRCHGRGGRAQPLVHRTLAYARNR